ncbi:hypothetical protein, partial [Lacticaseibacillus paracasei]|uniref:hypothetical protein n=1 Tax=Lacticaseibacillus paracasei TaxID=1597 RepID=UPI0021C3479B
IGRGNHTLRVIPRFCVSAFLIAWLIYIIFPSPYHFVGNVLVTKANGVAAIKNLNLESDAMKVISKATLSAPKINPALGDPR